MLHRVNLVGCVLAVMLVAVLTGGVAVAYPPTDWHISEVLIPGENWELVGEGYKFTEGPTPDAAGRVYFVDVPESKIYRVELDGKVTLFDDKAGRSSGLEFGPDGRLYSCRGGDKQIVAIDVTNKATEVLASDVASNDLTVDAKGGVYFTDPPGSRVWYIAPSKEKRVVAEGISPNGVTLWADGGTCVVTEGNHPWLWTYRVEKDGSLTSRERCYLPLQLPNGDDKPGSDGLKVDSDGRLYVATKMGLQMFDPLGRHAGTIAKPQPAFLSNVCFGGPKFDVLYVTCQDKVYRRNVKATGLKPRTSAKP